MHAHAGHPFDHFERLVVAAKKQARCVDIVIASKGTSASINIPAAGMTGLEVAEVERLSGTSKSKRGVKGRTPFRKSLKKEVKATTERLFDPVGC